TIRGTNFARVDFFLLREDGTKHLLNAIEDSLVQRDLIRHRVLHSGHPKTRQEVASAQKLDQLLAKKNFGFAYQPIVRSSDLKIFGYEALCRPQGSFFSDPK